MVLESIDPIEISDSYFNVSLSVEERWKHTLLSVRILTIN
jgi:hypothetical protein